MRHVARRFFPNLCHCVPHALAIRFIPRSCQAQADCIRFIKLFGHTAQQPNQSPIIDQPHIARPKLRPLHLPPAGIGQQRRGPRAAALDAESEWTLKCWAGRHARSLRALPLGFHFILRYANGMTDTEQALLDTLLELETAVAQVNADPKPDLMSLFNRLDELTAALPKDTSRDLLHYLHKKSFQKARLYLQGVDPEAGSCAH